MISYSALGRLALAVLPLLAGAQEQKAAISPQPFKTFNSTPIELNFAVSPKNPQKLTPGSLFLSPYNLADPNFVSGPLILSNNGQVVWDGSAAPYNIRGAIPFEPGMYKGNNVFGIWQGAFFRGGYGTGYGLIFDSSYQVIANITTTVQGEGVDFHEMQITKDGTALILVYAAKQSDLSHSNVTATDGSKGWILDNYVQEIDIATGKALFTWRALDHIDPMQGYVLPGQTGVNAQSPWDFLHFNSIAKDSKGNYLVSSRHYKALYYISSKGNIIWQLGGRNSSFTMGEGATFHYQHDARWIEEGKRLALFNNGASLEDQAEPRARSKILSLDMKNMKVSLEKDYPAYAQEVSQSQGGTRVQPNGDVLVGYGSRSWAAEFSAKGDVLWAASYPQNVQTYRINRFKWTGAPKTDPSIYVAPSSNKKSVETYISWNGDTRVTQWRIYASDKKTSSSDTMKCEKMGFETNCTFKTKWPKNTDKMYVWAEGIRGGKVVGTTRRVTLTKKGGSVSALSDSASTASTGDEEVDFTTDA